MSRQEHPIIESVRADIDGLDFADDDKRQNAEDSIICTVQTLIDRLADSADDLAAKDTALSEMLAELERVKNERDVLAYKLDQAVNTTQPMIVSRATAAEAQLERARKALGKVAAPYDGEDRTRLVPLVELGAELRRRQNIAKEAIRALAASQDEGEER